MRKIEIVNANSFFYSLVPDLNIDLIYDHILDVALDYDDVLASQIEDFFNLLKANNLLNEDVFFRANKKKYADKLFGMFQAIRKLRIGLSVCYLNGLIDRGGCGFFAKLDSADALFTFWEKQTFRKLCLKLDKDSCILLNTTN
jgi:hypothetical protein